jgi:hypothetical protein
MNVCGESEFVHSELGLLLNTLDLFLDHLTNVLDSLPTEFGLWTCTSEKIPIAINPNAQEGQRQRETERETHTDRESKNKKR